MCITLAGMQGGILSLFLQSSDWGTTCVRYW